MGRRFGERSYVMLVALSAYVVTIYLVTRRRH
jgi:hypothetical protein